MPVLKVTVSLGHLPAAKIQTLFELLVFRSLDNYIDRSQWAPVAEEEHIAHQVYGWEDSVYGAIPGLTSICIY